MRINRFISECGICSRRNADNMIDEGRVELNGEIIRHPGEDVNPDEDVIRVDGVIVKPVKKEYYVLYKPKGYVTTTKDEKKRPEVTKLIKSSAKIYPVGRLDINTTGVILLTNDGDFSNNLTHPSNKVPRVYSALLSKPLNVDDRLALTKGIFLDGRKSSFTEILFPDKKNFRRVEVTTVEGRNHFVKRMFKARGYFVKALHRVSFGEFDVFGMKPGEYKKINMPTPVRNKKK